MAKSKNYKQAMEPLTSRSIRNRILRALRDHYQGHPKGWSDETRAVLAEIVWKELDDLEYTIIDSPVKSPRWYAVQLLRLIHDTLNDEMGLTDYASCYWYTEDNPRRYSYEVAHGETLEVSV